LEKLKRWKRKRILIPIIVAVFVLLTFFWYVNDYYHSDESVQEYLQEDIPIKAKDIREGLYLDGPGKESALIFYPGAKVEYTAYLPLLYELAEQGVDCFLIKMPCNLAILGQNKAEDIIDVYEYKHWYLSGHSLGGVMAASYAAGHRERVDGLILLAAYPTKDLTGSPLSVLSVYGSEDGVLNMEKLAEGRSLMPADYTELCIEGGNHAGFGNYGKQKGDGEAKIPSEEQQRQTIEAITQMIDGQKETKQEDKTMHYQQITAQEAKKIIEEPEELPDKKQKILVCCRSGNRSRQVAQKLADMGYENVLEFGGIMN